MPSSQVMAIIIKHYRLAKKNGRRIPIHAISQAGRVQETAGAIMDIALRRKYGPIKDRLRGEEALEATRQAVAQTAVMCIRLLEKLNNESISSNKNKANVVNQNQDQGGEAPQEG